MLCFCIPSLYCCYWLYFEFEWCTATLTAPVYSLNESCRVASDDRLTMDWMSEESKVGFFKRFSLPFYIQTTALKCYHKILGWAPGSKYFVKASILLNLIPHPYAVLWQNSQQHFAELFHLIWDDVNPEACFVVLSSQNLMMLEAAV